MHARIRRAEPAAGVVGAGGGDVERRQHGVHPLSHAHARRHRVHRTERLSAAEADVPAEDGVGRVDRHDESHRAAGRIGSCRRQDPRSPPGRRAVQARGTEDFHHLRRTRSHAEHHSHGARPDAERSRGRQGHLLVPGPEVHGESRRVARRPQRRALSLRRAQARHTRESDLRAGVRTERRRGGRAHRGGKSRIGIHVHHDERGPIRRSVSKASACRSARCRARSRLRTIASKVPSPAKKAASPSSVTRMCAAC